MIPLIICALVGVVLGRPAVDMGEDRLDLPEERREDLFEGDIINYYPNRRNAIIKDTWPNARIPYAFDPKHATAFSAAEKQSIQQAFNEFARHSCVSIVPRSSSDSAYVNIIRGNGCYSSVGRIGNRQRLSLDKGCAGKGTVMHEFMHAAGFWHEQGRFDRDNYVTIMTRNIMAGKESNFGKMTRRGQAQTFGTSYDYSSIMHYGQYAFSKNGRPTIVPKQRGVKLGNRKGFSQTDIVELNKLYNCKPKNVLGCYKDSPYRDLPHVQFRGAYLHDMTHNKCINECSKGGYRYAGVQAGGRCNCGNSYGALGKAADRECIHKCTGNANENCGGHWRNWVMKIRDDLPGCYKDSANRDLPHMQFNGAYLHDMTQTKCINKCRQGGYRYAGVQARGRCFCGNSYGSQGMVWDSECNRKCTGNGRENCGAHWRNWVMKV